MKKKTDFCSHPNPREDEEIVFIQLKKEKTDFVLILSGTSFRQKKNGHHTPLDQKSSSFH